MVWIPEVDFDAEGEPYDTGKYFERPIQGVWDYTLLEGIPAWSLHRLMCLVFNSGGTHVELFEDDDAYEILMYKIEIRIKEGYFLKEYLVDLTGTDSHQDMVDAFGYAFEVMKAKKEE